GNGPAIGVVGDGAGLRRPSHVHRVQEPEERDRADALRCVRAPPGDRVTGVDGAGVAVVAEGSDAVADYDPEGVDLAPVSGGAAVLVVAGDAGDDRREAGPRLAVVEGAGIAVIALDRRVGARPGQGIARVGRARVGVGTAERPGAHRGRRAGRQDAGVARGAGVPVAAG